jgi:hypothetical protein
LAAAGLVVAVAGVLVSFTVPEVRNFVGLSPEEPHPIAAAPQTIKQGNNSVSSGASADSRIVAMPPQPVISVLSLKFDKSRSLNESLRKCWEGIVANYPPGVTPNGDIQSALSTSEAVAKQGEQALRAKDSNALNAVTQELDKFNQILRQHQLGSRDPCP